PRIVILDEATARMDPVTEGRVQRATERLLRDRIGIVIAHRLSSDQRCDEVVVLADGRVAEAGPLRESAQFARLFAASQGTPVPTAPADPAGVPAAAGPGTQADAAAAGQPAGGLALADLDESPQP